MGYASQKQRMSGEFLLFFVPKGEADIEAAVGIAHASDAVLAPTVGSKAGLMVCKI